jgi:gas vesicle protein
MADGQRSSKFGLGLVFGMITGALAGLFLAPKSGKENREAVAKKITELRELLEEKEIDKKVQEIFGEVTAEAKELYLKVKEELINRLAELKESLDKIDREKYLNMVEEVMKTVRTESRHNVHQVEKLKEDLVKNWNRLVQKYHS